MLAVVGLAVGSMVFSTAKVNFDPEKVSTAAKLICAQDKLPTDILSGNNAVLQAYDSSLGAMQHLQSDPRTISELREARKFVSTFNMRADAYEETAIQWNDLRDDSCAMPEHPDGAQSNTFGTKVMLIPFKIVVLTNLHRGDGLVGLMDNLILLLPPEYQAELFLYLPQTGLIPTDMISKLREAVSSIK